jgi:hypothetical protein
MAVTKRTLILSLLASVVAALLVRSSFSEAQRASASELHISPQHCAADANGWLAQTKTTWPTDEILLGDQVYTRSRLWNLSHSEGNPVADLALSLAAAQLNLAAGAKPGADLVDALFEADQWLLDKQEAHRRSQEDSKSLVRLAGTLNQFNRWAASSDECGATL